MCHVEGHDYALFYGHECWPELASAKVVVSQISSITSNELS